MAWVVTENCVLCKYTDCVSVCPVDCFYEASSMLVIHPDECIDCGFCEPECPADALCHEDELPADQLIFASINARLAEQLPTIRQQKAPPSDADHWNGRADKRGFIRELDSD